MSLISPIDSYFTYLQNQMAILNTAGLGMVTINGNTVPQPFGGVVNARDWPATPPDEGALYLLVLNTVPGGIVSQTQMGYEYFCQWTWLLIGTDIQPTQMVQSRADRYRQNMQIMKNLRDATYPGWCVKQDYSASQQGVVTGVPSSTLVPYNTIEMVIWSNLRFMPKQDNQKSGLVFGAAAVELQAYDDISQAVA
jgi:hypothetical protein